MTSEPRTAGPRSHGSQATPVFFFSLSGVSEAEALSVAGATDATAVSVLKGTERFTVIAVAKELSDLVLVESELVLISKIPTTGSGAALEESKLALLITSAAVKFPRLDLDSGEREF